jgi:hypothetical protein
MNDGGYFKLWRKIVDWDVWQAMSHEQRSVLITIIAMANWKDGTWFCKNTKKSIHISRGSFVSTLKNIANKADVGIQVVRTTIELLKVDHGNGPFLTHTPTRHYSMFTICNYNKYQDVPEDANTRANTTSTQRQHNVNTDRRSIKKDKKNIYASIPDFIQLAARAWMRALSWDDKKIDNNLETWLDSLDKLNRLDSHDWPEIFALISFIMEDKQDGKWKGWFYNCRSPMKLRLPNKSNPGESNYDVIQRQQQNAKPRYGKVPPLCP